MLFLQSVRHKSPGFSLLWQPLALLALLWTLSGCETSQPKPSAQTPTMPSAQASTPEEALQKAQQADSPEAEKLLLHAADLLMLQRRYPEAQKVLDSIHYQSLSDPMRADFILAQGRLYIENQQPEQAVALLTTNQLGLYNFVDFLPAQKQVDIGELRAQAYAATGNALAAARERIFFGPLLDAESAIQNNNEQIWQSLLSLPVETLEQLAQQTASSDFQGWAELAYLAKSYQDSLDQQLEQLKAWQQRWPNHSANRQLPGDMKALAQAALEKPEIVALLLPTTGRYETAAKTILDGFMSAHYAAQESGVRTPKLLIYNTGEQGIVALYRQAVADGAELIVGPLDKDNVEALAKQDQLPVKTLALNYIPGLTEVPDNLFQFGLASEDEAKQIADRAWMEGHQNAAIFYPDNDWGFRVQTAFVDHWLSLGGNIVAQTAFDREQTFSDPIESMLNLDDSKRRASEIRRLANQSIEFEPRRRQDIDFIVMLSSSQEGRQIKPTLNFHYAQSLPVYATSRINGGEANADQDKDLNGVRFVDIPWVLTDGGRIKQKSNAVWPNRQGETARLHALGVDAYRLYPRLGILQAVANGAVFGATGRLRLTEGQRIERELLWAEFRRGRVVSLPMVIQPDASELEKSNQPTDRI